MSRIVIVIQTIVTYIQIMFLIGFFENVIIIDVGSVLVAFFLPIRNSVMPSEL
jgi:hypothetical protein